MRSALLAVTLCAWPLFAQAQVLSTGLHGQGYDFDDAFGVRAVNLLLVPLAYQQPLGQRLSGDLYSAFARGAVNIGGTEYTLSGPVDTRVRLNWTATPWAVVSLSMNVPTGNETHSENEARVASALSTELLGFREASWGLGFGATTGIATASRLGEWGVGFGASYRLASGFEPRADTAFTYTPGNETRVRLAFDRNLRGNRLTLGAAFQRYSKDELDGRNLFQSGNRYRADATYSFRTGASATWTAFATDIWREQGDILVPVVSIDPETGEPVAQENTRTGTQNLLIAGLSGSVRVTPALAVRPTADFRLQTREEQGGSGWLIGVGGDVPLRRGRIDMFPSARISYGSIENADANGFRVLGGEIGLTLRWGR